MNLGALFKGRSKTPILAALIVMLLCCSLSYWQWQRAVKKHELNQDIEKQQQLNLANGVNDNKRQLTEKINGEVQLTGHFIDGAIWYLDNQVVKGRVGFDVISILKMRDTGEYVVVNLGFVPQQASRMPTPISLSEAQVSIPAYIKTSSSKRFTLADSAAESESTQSIIQYIDIDYLSKASNHALLPIIAYMTQDILGSTKPHYQPVVMSPQKHEAYAVQWLLIAIAAAVIGWKLSKKENKNV
ncbi:SURF1 family protein [Pseudoalteromonas piscicida]|uniref:SURF1 family protein n=1 Tax=Pseudoalteromonas piscicida TaxID=43662 RepID=UPI0030A48FBB